MCRFTIRELLLLTATIALGVSWSLDRCRLCAESQAALTAAKESELSARRSAASWSASYQKLKLAIGRIEKKLADRNLGLWWGGDDLDVEVISRAGDSS